MKNYFCTSIALACIAAVPLPAFAGDTTEQNAVKLFETMQGRFDSSAQAAADEEFRDVTMTICEVNIEKVPPSAGGRFLYVEQALSSTLNAPYRQRFYRIKNIEKLGKIASTTYKCIC